MPRPVPVLGGTLVTLRPLAPESDAEDYYRWNLDPEMHVWTGNEPFGTVQEARDELRRLSGIEDITTWAVVDNASGRMMGRFFICLEQRGGRLVAGEGNRIARQFWRKGHNREARRLVFGYVFNSLGADCIETECWTDNINSRESILAHGFALIGETVECSSKHGQSMSKSHFRMTRQEWLDRRDEIGGTPPIVP